MVNYFYILSWHILKDGSLLEQSETSKKYVKDTDATFHTHGHPRSYCSYVIIPEMNVSYFQYWLKNVRWHSNILKVLLAMHAILT